MVVKKLDVVTQVCPFPLIEAKAAMAELASGDQLVIEFDCTQATEAIPQWAAEAKKLGLDGFDISVMFLKNHTPVYLRGLKEQLAEVGLPIAMA